MWDIHNLGYQIILLDLGFLQLYRYFFKLVFLNSVKADFDQDNFSSLTASLPLAFISFCSGNSIPLLGTDITQNVATQTSMGAIVDTGSVIGGFVNMFAQNISSGTWSNLDIQNTNLSLTNCFLVASISNFSNTTGNSPLFYGSIHSLPPLTLFINVYNFSSTSITNTHPVQIGFYFTYFFSFFSKSISNYKFYQHIVNPIFFKYESLSKSIYH